jgi:hypothetical protein
MFKYFMSLFSDSVEKPRTPENSDMFTLTGMDQDSWDWIDALLDSTVGRDSHENPVANVADSATSLRDVFGSETNSNPFSKFMDNNVYTRAANTSTNELESKNEYFTGQLLPDTAPIENSVVENSVVENSVVENSVVENSVVENSVVDIPVVEIPDDVKKRERAKIARERRREKVRVKRENKKSLAEPVSIKSVEPVPIAPKRRKRALETDEERDRRRERDREHKKQKRDMQKEADTKLLKSLNCDFKINLSYLRKAGIKYEGMTAEEMKAAETRIKNARKFKKAPLVCAV